MVDSGGGGAHLEPSADTREGSGGLGGGSSTPPPPLEHQSPFFCARRCPFQARRKRARGSGTFCLLVSMKNLKMSSFFQTALPCEDPVPLSRNPGSAPGDPKVYVVGLIDKSVRGATILR